MTDHTLCGHCQARPTPAGRTLCPPCTVATADHLRTIASLSGHLDDKRAGVRAIDYRGTTTSGSKEARLPYDERVTHVETAIRATLTDLAGYATLNAPTDLGTAWAPDSRSIASVALWLVEFTPWLATLDDGPNWARDLEHHAHRITGLFDGPAPRMPIGPCLTPHDSAGFCHELIYVRTDDNGHPATATTSCGYCGTTHDVDTIRARTLDLIDGQRLTIRALARHLVGQATIEQLKYLARTGRITPAGETHENGHTATTYRVGDVRTAIADNQHRMRKRATRDEAA